MTDHSIRETVADLVDAACVAARLDKQATYADDKANAAYITDRIHTAYLSAGWREVPAGFVVVPREPTLEMMSDGWNWIEPDSTYDVAMKRAWAAMLSASPQPEVKP